MSDEMKMVLIEWDDSASAKEDVWLSPKQWVTRYSKIRSVGFVVNEDNDCITIMAHLADCGKDGPESGKGGISIPKSCITSRYDLSATIVAKPLGSN